jgi:hypothetical protein
MHGEPKKKKKSNFCKYIKEYHPFVSMFNHSQLLFIIINLIGKNGILHFFSFFFFFFRCLNVCLGRDENLFGRAMDCVSGSSTVTIERHCMRNYEFCHKRCYRCMNYILVWFTLWDYDTCIYFEISLDTASVFCFNWSVII